MLYALPGEKITIGGAAMASTRMTTKGRITIPVTVRAALGLSAGTRVEFVRLDRGKFAIVAASPEVRSLKGFFTRSSSVTTDEMNDAIAERGARQDS
jgi:AbrB family looped-hinge helix DNA binding protein